MKSSSEQHHQQEEQQVSQTASSDQYNHYDPRKEQLIGRGLYKKVRISVQMLDIMITLGIAAIILVIFFAVRHSGYTVSFNSKGGTDVSSGSYEYGNTLVIPDDPTREGYDFEGWYLDENYSMPLEEPYSVESDVTFYARWEPAS